MSPSLHAEPDNSEIEPNTDFEPDTEYVEGAVEEEQNDKTTCWVFSAGSTTDRSMPDSSSKAAGANSTGHVFSTKNRDVEMWDFTEALPILFFMMMVMSARTTSTHH